MFPLDEKERKKLSSCDKTKIYYEVEFANLQPGSKYDVLFRSQFSNLLPSRYCANDKCGVNVNVVTPG